jgi:hypothetical protein
MKILPIRYCQYQWVIQTEEVVQSEPASAQDHQQAFEHFQVTPIPAQFNCVKHSVNAKCIYDGSGPASLLCICQSRITLTSITYVQTLQFRVELN